MAKNFLKLLEKNLLFLPSCEEHGRLYSTTELVEKQIFFEVENENAVIASQKINLIQFDNNIKLEANEISIRDLKFVQEEMNKAAAAALLKYSDNELIIIKTVQLITSRILSEYDLYLVSKLIEVEKQGKDLERRIVNAKSEAEKLLHRVRLVNTGSIIAIGLSLIQAFFNDNFGFPDWFLPSVTIVVLTLALVNRNYEEKFESHVNTGVNPRNTDIINISNNEVEPEPEEGYI